MSDLKPCPFCGDEGWLHSHGSVLSDAHVGHRVECEGKCHSTTCYWHSKEEAITAWNTRHIDAAQIEAETINSVKNEFMLFIENLDSTEFVTDEDWAEFFDDCLRKYEVK